MEEGPQPPPRVEHLEVVAEETVDDVDAVARHAHHRIRVDRCPRMPDTVRPGDALMLHAHVLDVRRSKSHPGLGVLRWRWQLVNQRDVAVLELVATSLFELAGADR